MAIHVGHGERRLRVATGKRHRVPLFGDAVERGEQNACRRFAFVRFLRKEAEQILQVIDGKRAIDQIATIAFLHDLVCQAVAILVVDAPHDLLHDIAHRDDARRATVLVNNHGDLGMTALQQLQ